MITKSKVDIWPAQQGAWSAAEVLVARTSSTGSTAGSATMQVPALAVSAEATTESGHPNLAGVECPG